jgi:hypothetical protein
MTMKKLTKKLTKVTAIVEKEKLRFLVESFPVKGETPTVIMFECGINI